MKVPRKKQQGSIRAPQYRHQVESDKKKDHGRKPKFKSHDDPVPILDDEEEDDGE
tara:strand:- start:68592 stop:68756 length:165 start_codon:yes stop_codon:yes gene_type:complete